MFILAHRGVRSRTATENTLEAFHAGVLQGADGIELDLHVSRDNEIVVIHDQNLHRVAGNAHQISELTAAELQAIPLRHGGRIPTLNQVTSSIHAPIILDMEVKTLDVVPLLVAKLKTSAALRERTIVSSFHPSVIEAVNDRLPGIRTLLLVSRWPLPLRYKKFRDRIGLLRPWAVGLPLIRMNRRRVAFIRRLGVLAATWDQRGLLREARRAVRLGVDIAIIQHVREARACLEKTYRSPSF